MGQFGACRVFKNVKLGRKQPDTCYIFKPENDGIYVLLSYIYARMQKWGKVRRMRKLMLNVVNGVSHTSG